jgi:subtilisin family serine protease
VYSAALRWLLIVTIAFGGSISTADDLSYVTANTSLDDLPQEMARYYLKLDAKNELPVRWVRDDIGLQMRHVVYGLGLLRGSGMTSGITSSLDGLLCRLNSHVCGTDGEGNPTWRNQKNSRLCVPAVVWTNALSISRTNEYQTKGLEWLEGRYGTCSVIGTKDCAETVKEIAKRGDRDGWIEVPVLSQGALQFQGKPITQCSFGGVVLNISEQLSEKGYEYVRTLRPDVPLSPPINLEMQKILGEQVYEAEGRDLDSTSSIDTSSQFEIITLKKMIHRVAAREEEAERQASRQWIEMQAASETAIYVDAALAELEEAPIHRTAAGTSQRPVHSLDGVTPPVTPSAENLTPPFMEVLSDIELDEYFMENPKKVRSDVLVLDFRANRCHPVIRHAVANQYESCTQVKNPSSYSLLTNPIPPKKHHGTHISGLIAGTHGIGVRPAAKIDVYDLIREGEPDKTIFDYSLEQAVTAAIQKRRSSIRVVNLSVDFNLGRGSGIYEKLENTFQVAGSVLFVTAAGDDPASLDGVCEVLPACIEAKQKDNIMVVGGAKKSADNQWSLHERSRYGMRVDIVAPAESVLSASSDSDSLVRLSGTSQATALVSGVAARLFDAPPPQSSEWQPAQVKNRLKATARLLSALSSKTSSGLLSADSALENHQVLIYQREAADGQLHEVKVRGQLLEIVDADGGETDGFIRLVAPGLAEGVVSFCRMYRYHRAPAGDITFFYEPASEQSLTRWLLMTRYSGARLLTTTKKLVFSTTDKPNDPLYVPINRVVGFSDKFSGARACSNPKQ